MPPLTRLRELLGLIRFSHTVFALPFALLAAALAWNENETEFRWRDLAGILLCMVFARAAAMAFNRLADRRLDARNPRTQGRHLPAGILSIRSVALFTALNCAAFVAATSIFLPNPWPLILSLPVLALLLGYSYAKRFTRWCHYWLSAALMLSPLAAWIAIRGTLDWPPALLGAAVFFWVGGFDMLYACQDVEFDRGAGLHSVPARYGVPIALKLAAASHALTVICLIALWWGAGLGWIFLGGVVAVAALLVYEHRLVRPDDLSRVNLAFFHLNAIISLGLFAVGVADLLLASS
ncbi:MAG: UbiA-like polyprenyltransferase [Planctomycetales bacterium]